MIRLAIITSVLAIAPQAFAQLPADDSGKYSIVVLTRDIPCRDCERLGEAINDADLLPIIASAKLFAFTPRSPIYQLRYADTISSADAPTIALVRPDGGVIYKASGPAIPPPAELAYQLRRFATLDRGMAVQPQRFAGIDPIENSPRVPTLRRPPRFIPDTVVVRPTLSPTVNVAAPNIVFLVIVGSILLVFTGIGLVIIVSLGFFFLTR